MNKLIRLACVVATCSFALIGCKKEESSTTQPSASAGKTLKICFLPKQLQNPYFQSCATGAREAAKELGNVEVIYDGPQDGAADKAASMIEKWTNGRRA
jgi:rhamnose transport system substrate-binding protein